MRQCTWCGNKGWLLSLSSDGLCQKCDTTVKARVVAAMGTLHENLAQMRKARDLETRLARSQGAIRSLRELVPFFERGLVTLKPSPQEWVARIYVTERRFVREHIEGMVKAAMSEPADANPDRPTRTEQFNRVIETIETYRLQLGEAQAMQLRKRVEQLLSGLLLENAERDTSRGHRERALDQYIEALDMMRTDLGVNPDQQLRIDSIKRRIRDLGGKVPKRWEEPEKAD